MTGATGQASTQETFRTPFLPCESMGRMDSSLCACYIECRNAFPQSFLDCSGRLSIVKPSRIELSAILCPRACMEQPKDLSYG